MSLWTTVATCKVATTKKKVHNKIARHKWPASIGWVFCAPKKKCIKIGFNLHFHFTTNFSNKKAPAGAARGGGGMNINKFDKILQFQTNIEILYSSNFFFVVPAANREKKFKKCKIFQFSPYKSFGSVLSLVSSISNKNLGKACLNNRAL